MAHSSTDCTLAEEDRPMTLINRLLRVVRGRRLAHEPEHSQRCEHGAQELGRGDPGERRSGFVARTGNSVTVVSHSGRRSQRSVIAVRIRTGQAAALAGASGLLLAACGGSSQASQSTAVSSTVAASGRTSARQASGDAAFCGAARRIGSDLKTFARYEQREPARATATVLRRAKDAVSGFVEMQRRAPGSLTADVNVYARMEKPFIEGVVANRGQLRQERETHKGSGMQSGERSKGSGVKMKSGSETSGNRKLQSALGRIGSYCGFPGSLLMPSRGPMRG
jgi:hypothetical protein